MVGETRTLYCWLCASPPSGCDVATLYSDRGKCWGHFPHALELRDSTQRNTNSQASPGETNITTNSNSYTSFSPLGTTARSHNPKQVKLPKRRI